MRKVRLGSNFVLDSCFLFRNLSVHQVNLLLKVGFGGLDGVIQLLQASIAPLHLQGLSGAKGFEARLPGLSPNEEDLLKLL